MKKLLFLFLINFSIAASAQTTLFDQPNASLLQLNSSYAGSNGGFRAQSSFRTQDFFSAQINFALDGYVKRVNGGLFLSGNHSEIFHKIIIDDVLTLGYAQHISLFDDELKIIPSFKLSLMRSEFSQIFSSTLGAPPIVVRSANLTYAILFKYKLNYTVGMSIFDVHAPTLGLLENESPRNRQLRMHAAYTIHISNKRLLQVMTICDKSIQMTEIMVNANYVLNHFLIGLGAKTSGNYAAFMGFRGDYFAIQTSYAFNGSRLAPFYSRIWEVHLSANIRDKAHRRGLTNIENW